jgi:hypothetical protein
MRQLLIGHGFTRIHTDKENKAFSMRVTFTLSIALLAALFSGPSGRAAGSRNPAIEKIVAEISQERIGSIMKRLEGFGTRHVLSDQSSTTQGIGAAQHWIVGELKSYSPRLEVKVDSFSVKKTPRIVHDAELTNIIAMLPGKVEKDCFVVISAHYDSLHLVRKPGAAPGDISGTDWEASASSKTAPGVVDDGSGVAAVMELARVMSQ